MSAPALRRLPASEPRWETSAEIVVVGAGAAGMSAALAAAAHGRDVLLLAKAEDGGGSTPLAQGGLAAAVGPDDAPRIHRQDTLDAGAGLCEAAAVDDLARRAPAVVASLAALGARLDRAALHLEGGHSRRRIVHAADATGAEAHRVLAAAVAASTVRALTGAVALDILLDERGAAAGVLAGLVGDDGNSLTAGIVSAPAVVLATGGFGQAYAATTNPAGVTGDGLALAARAGAEIRDVEFVQFHPTVLWAEGGAGHRPLVTEALRGAGAVLVDSAGRRVMRGRHPLADLAPRDVVAAAMQELIEAGCGARGHLWLDATGLGRRVLEEGFPTVTALCRSHGIDPAAEPIPVAPGAHYACGGIRADMNGRTSVEGLHAVGEAASTGVHGANRLASNSLVESLITGQRAGTLLGRSLPSPPAPPLRPPPGRGACAAVRADLAAAMSAHAGVLRDEAGLERVLRTLDEAPAALPAGAGQAQRGCARPGAAARDGAADLRTAEATSLHNVSVLVAAAALARRESRGCHRRRDAPLTFPVARHTLARWQDGVVRLTTGDPAEVGA